MEDLKDIELGEKIYGSFLNQDNTMYHIGAFQSEESYYKEGIDESMLKGFDSIFTPLDDEMTLYKGICGEMGATTPEEELSYYLRMTGVKKVSELIGKSFVDKAYSSLTEVWGVAEDYAYRNADVENQEWYGVPIIIEYRISENTPITRPSWHGYSNIDYEWTLRRNLKYTITSVTKIFGEDEHYEIEMNVEPNTDMD
jgi:hypothetical protein